jgi:fatty acid/phospholipid biosynthesis enzyme
MVMNAVIGVSAEVFAETARRAQKLGMVAPKLEHSESIFLNALGCNVRLSGEQIDLMPQPGKRLRQATHRLARPAVALLKTGNNLGDSHGSREPQKT